MSTICLLLGYSQFCRYQPKLCACTDCRIILLLSAIAVVSFQSLRRILLSDDERSAGADTTSPSHLVALPHCFRNVYVLTPTYSWKPRARSQEQRYRAFVCECVCMFVYFRLIDILNNSKELRPDSNKQLRIFFSPLLVDTVYMLVKKRTFLLFFFYFFW